MYRLCDRFVLFAYKATLFLGLPIVDANARQLTGMARPTCQQEGSGSFAHCDSPVTVESIIICRSACVDGATRVYTDQPD